MFSIEPEQLSKPHIYFLYQNDEIVYIGQSSNLCYRIGQHVNSLKEFNNVKSYVYELPDILAEEQKLIQKYNPKYNKKHRDDLPYLKEGFLYPDFKNNILSVKVSKEYMFDYKLIKHDNIIHYDIVNTYKNNNEFVGHIRYDAIKNKWIGKISYSQLDIIFSSNNPLMLKYSRLNFKGLKKRKF